MKKVGDLMKEAGFNPKSSDSVKEAYIKHLIKASTGVSATTPSEKKEIKAHPEKIFPLKAGAPVKSVARAALPQQLSFDFEESAEPSVEINKSKISS